MVEESTKLNLSKFKLIIFDFDGVIADSLGAYRELDRLIIKDLYGVDEKIETIEDISRKIRAKITNDNDSDYYRYLDKKYGDGKKPLEEIWGKVFELAPIVQANIEPKVGVLEVLENIRQKANCPISLATSSSRSDIDFFSTKKSKIGRQIDLKNYFDTIVTFDDVVNPKPDPEPFLKIIKKYSVDPKSVLIFEDSLFGVLAGKKIGTTVVAIEDFHNSINKQEIINNADFYIEGWQALLF